MKDPMITIYAGKKKIRILREKPEITRGKWNKGINTDRGLKDVYREFEEAKGNPALTIWPEDGKINLRKSFFSLFKFVEAAGGVVRNEKGEILFIYRYGKWDLPKGKISGSDRKAAKEKGKRKDVIPWNEVPEARCAIREVMEETGLGEVSLVRELFPTFHIFKVKNRNILKRTTWFEMFAESSQPLHPQKEESILKVKWIPVDRIRHVVEKTYPSLRKLLVCIK